MTNASHEILRARDREMIPPALLRMMLALVIASLLLVSWAVATGRQPTGQPGIDQALAFGKAEQPRQSDQQRDPNT